MILSENVIFQGLRLSLGHFGQQALKSHVSQLQNSVSTSPLPPSIVDLLTFKDCPRSKLESKFFNWNFREGVKWQTSKADYKGPKQQYVLIITRVPISFDIRIGLCMNTVH